MTTLGQAPCIVEIPQESVEDGLIDGIFSGRHDGVLVRGAADSDACAALVERLQAGGVDPIVGGLFPGTTYGAVLLVCAPDLVEYRRLTDQLARVLADSTVGAAMSAAVAQLAAPRAVETPKGYAQLTVRVLHPGQDVAVHSERSEWPSMAGLHGPVDFTHQLSFYLPLQVPEAGGDLIVYHRPPRGREPSLEGVRPAQAHASLAAFGASVVRPGVGDLLVFNGGRFNHRVTPVESGERWTIGGFASPGTPPGTLCTWS